MTKPTSEFFVPEDIPQLPNTPYVARPDYFVPVSYALKMANVKLAKHLEGLPVYEHGDGFTARLWPIQPAETAEDLLRESLSDWDKYFFADGAIHNEEVRRRADLMERVRKFLKQLEPKEPVKNE